MTFLGKWMKNLTLHSKFTCFPFLLYLNIKGRNLKYIDNGLPYTGTPMLRNNIFKSVAKMSIIFTLIYQCSLCIMIPVLKARFYIKWK